MGARAPQTGNVCSVHPAQYQGGGTSSRRVRQIPGKRQRQRSQALSRRVLRFIVCVVHVPT